MGENDRELLELAAEAMGHRITGWNTQRGAEVAVLDDHSYWQPLLENGITDCMGDALRLAVKLNLTVQCSFASVWVESAAPKLEIVENHNNKEAAAATRRAIVRAAAEIGKEMT